MIDDRQSQSQKSFFSCLTACTGHCSVGPCLLGVIFFLVCVFWDLNLLKCFLCFSFCVFLECGEAAGCGFSIQWLPRIVSLLTVPPIWSPFVLRYVNHEKHNEYMAIAKKDQNILSYRRLSIQWLPITASVLTVPFIWSHNKKHNEYMAIPKKDQNILSYRRHSIPWLPIPPQF